MNLFARALRNELGRLRWDLNRLAAATGLPYQTVWRYFHGEREPTLRNALLVVRALGFSSAWFDVIMPEEREDTLRRRDVEHAYDEAEDRLAADSR